MGDLIFDLTHHAREPVTRQGGTTYTFVTEGIQAALERARAAAGDRDVMIGGGGSVVRQSWRLSRHHRRHHHRCRSTPRSSNRR
jgi:dihydrofolate reductase